MFLAGLRRLFPQHFGMVAFGFATTGRSGGDPPVARRSAAGGADEGLGAAVRRHRGDRPPEDLRPRNRRDVRPLQHRPPAGDSGGCRSGHLAGQVPPAATRAARRGGKVVGRSLKRQRPPRDSAVSGRFSRAGEGVRTLDVHLGKTFGVRIAVGELSRDAGLPSQGVSGRPAPSRSGGYVSGYAAALDGPSDCSSQRTGVDRPSSATSLCDWFRRCLSGNLE